MGYPENMNYFYAPYIPILTTPTQTWTNLSSANGNQINFANGQINLTSNAACAGNIQLTGGITHDPPPAIYSGANMPASFVSDKYVQANLYGQSLSAHEKFSDFAENGATLSPLLKKMVDEANTLEKEKKDLLKNVEDLKRDTERKNAELSQTASIIARLRTEKDELEGKLANQAHNIQQLQISHEELQQAHNDLRQVIRDYSEDEVNQLVDDYHMQFTCYEAEIAYYEEIIRQYEREKHAKELESIREVEKLDEKSELFTPQQIEKICAAFRHDLLKMQDPEARDRLLKKMNDPVGGYTQEQVDRMIEDAKLELIAKMDAETTHEEKFMHLGPGKKVWQSSTGRGPFWTQVLKPFVHKDKDKTSSFGWLVHNKKGKEEHFPIGDLTVEEPVQKGPSKLRLAFAGCVNAVGMQLIALQAFGPKAIIPVAVAQTIIAGVTYWELSKKA